jgi:hypothetical protein
VDVGISKSEVVSIVKEGAIVAVVVVWGPIGWVGCKCADSRKQESTQKQMKRMVCE